VKALVTGATGFLGGAVVRRCLDRGIAVRALARDPEAARRRFPPSVEVVRGDLTTPQAVIAALDGCDALLHLAALVKRKAPKALFDLVNVQATESLLGTAVARGIRAVYTSSFFALGPSDGMPEGRSHASPPAKQAPHTDYERTKREADRRLERLRGGSDPLITLYPGVLYGPGELTEANLVTALIRDHLRGRVPGLPAGGRRTWCYAYVDDVADAHLAALERGAPGGQYTLPGDNRTARDFFVELQRLTGLAPPRFTLPIPVVWVAGWADEIAAGIVGREPKLTRAEALTYAHDWALDGRSGAAALAARATPLGVGLERTVAWLRERDPRLFSRLAAH